MIFSFFKRENQSFIPFKTFRHLKIHRKIEVCWELAGITRIPTFLLHAWPLDSLLNSIKI